MRFRPLRHAVITVAAFASFIVLGGSMAMAQPKYGGHLRVGWRSFATSLDPVLGRTGSDGYYWTQIFDSLVDADAQLKPRPASSLAESWEISQNPDAITLKLRDGVTFHDGTKFDAEAVKKNIERTLDPATGATPRSSFGVIKSVEVLGPLSVRLNLTSPWGAGLATLADRGGQMSSPTAIEKFGKDYQWNPSGTGPFRVDKVVTGSFVHMVRNENYWGKDAKGNKLPYLDEITIRQIADASVLTSALRAGEIDVAYVPYKDVDAFQKDSRFNIEKVDGGSLAYHVTFNPDKPPLDNPDLRRAITYAINPVNINQSVFFGRALVADAGMWPVGAWVHDPSVPRPHFDLAKAREFLKKGGKPDGFEFTAVTNNVSDLAPAGEIVAAQLARIGIKMKLEVLTPNAATTGFFQDHKWNSYFTTWSRYPEPDQIAALNYRSGAYYNPSAQKRPDIDELVQKGASLYDVGERKKVYNEINRIVLGESLAVPLIYGVTYAVAPKKVKNLDTLVGWDGKMNLRELWIDK